MAKIKLQGPHVDFEAEQAPGLDAAWKNLIQETDQAGEKSEESSSAIKKAARESRIKINFIQHPLKLALDLAVKAFRSLVDEQRESYLEDLAHIEKASVVAEERDVVMTKVWQQMGALRGSKKATEVKAFISRMAEKYGMKFESVASVVRELASQGFAEEEITVPMGSSEQMFQILTAFSQGGISPGDAARKVQNFAAFITAAGGAKNAVGLRKAGIATFGLFRGTPLQLSALTEFASESVSVRMATQEPIRQQLATLSIMVEEANETRAASGYRRTVEILSSIAANKDKTKILTESFGLSPQDLQFIGAAEADEGESAVEVILARLEEAGKKMDPADFRVKLFQLVGMRGVTPLLTLMRTREQIRERVKMTYAEPEFAQSVRVGGESLAAKRRRADEREARTMDWDQASLAIQFMKDLLTEAREQGVPPRLEEGIRRRFLQNLQGPEARMQINKAALTAAKGSTPLLRFAENAISGAIADDAEAFARWRPQIQKATSRAIYRSQTQWFSAFREKQIEIKPKSPPAGPAPTSKPPPAATPPPTTKPAPPPPTTPQAAPDAAETPPAPEKPKGPIPTAAPQTPPAAPQKPAAQKPTAAPAPAPQTPPATPEATPEAGGVSRVDRGPAIAEEDPAPARISYRGQEAEPIVAALEGVWGRALSTPVRIQRHETRKAVRFREPTRELV